MTVCAFTTFEQDASLVRVVIQPNPTNGLSVVSRVMVDKVSTFTKSKLSRRIGRLGDEDIRRLDRALMAFLGLDT